MLLLFTSRCHNNHHDHHEHFSLLIMIKEFFSFKFFIRQLIENNYFEWLVDIRTHLRFKKLWKYTQFKVDDDLIVAQKFKWVEIFEKAVDVMISIINESIKQKFNEIEFNCDYVMLLKIIFLLQSIDDVEYMRLTKKYYTFKYEFFNSMFDYFTHIKLLKKRMRITKTTFIDDKQIFLCLIMSLFENFQYLTKIWVTTKNFIVDITRNMLLKKNRRAKSNLSSYDFSAQQQASLKKWCNLCQKPHDEENC